MESDAECDDANGEAGKKVGEGFAPVPGPNPAAEPPIPLDSNSAVASAGAPKILPKPEFADRTLQADGSEFHLSPDGTRRLIPAGSPIPAATREIAADQPPEKTNKLKPLFIAAPVALLVFLLAFTVLGKRNKMRNAVPSKQAASLPSSDLQGQGSDFRD